LKPKLKKYFWNVLIGLDQLANTLLGGYPDETFSARAWRKTQAGQRFWRLLCRLIDGFFVAATGQPDHCRESYANEAARGHSPSEHLETLRGDEDNG
jgi:hypothetical protein